MMGGEMMTFPETWEEYEEHYGFDDREQLYSNGARLIMSHWVEKWLNHLETPEGEWITDEEEYINCSNCMKERWSKNPFEHLVCNFKYCPNCGAKMKKGNMA